MAKYSHWRGIMTKIGRHQGINRQKTQRGRTVNDHIIIQSVKVSDETAKLFSRSSMDYEFYLDANHS